MKTYIKELFISPINTLFICVGFTIAIYSFSIGISFFSAHFLNYNDVNVFSGKNFIVTLNFSTDVAANTIIDKLNTNSSNASFISAVYSIDTKQKNRTNRLTGVYNYLNISKIYPLYSGRYFTTSEMLSNKKYAMVGYNIKDEIYEKNGERYIDILGHSYKVIGIIGRSSETYWGIQILVPFKAMPSEILQAKARKLMLNYPIESLENTSYFSELEKNLKENGLTSIDKAQNQSSIKKVTKRTYEDNKSDYNSLIFTILLSIASLFTFSTFWATNLKRNFAIKRILGANSFFIIKTLFLQILIISIFSTAVSFILTVATLSVFKIILRINGEFNMINIIFGGVFAIIITMINTLWIYKDILKFNVIESIK